ncbi:MAG: ornithine cyclodeaminase family protein [Rhodospirillaceae bacterium]
MTSAPLWITEKEVTSAVALPDAMDALERILMMEGDGKAKNMTKAHLMVAENDAMHALGASAEGAGLCGFKTWINVRGKSETIVSLFSLEDGALKAIIEATALGQLRTAAMTGVGTRRMAVEKAEDMAIIGTGKQALPQIGACNIARPLKRLRVYSRNAENRGALVQTIKKQFDFEVVDATSLNEAVDGAQIITLVTNATQPFLTSDMVFPGTHINAMGAIVPARVEFTEDIFSRCDLIAVDNQENIRNLSAEFRSYYGEDEERWSKLLTIGKVISQDLKRPPEADLTLFKAMGMGLSDLAVAIEVYSRISKEGVSHKVPERIKLPPRLR